MPFSLVVYFVSYRWQCHFFARIPLFYAVMSQYSLIYSYNNNNS